MILTIRHLSGSLSGRSQRVALRDGQTLTLGRAADSDIRFSDDADDSVSNVHAELTLDGDQLYVEDKRSSNGTFVNGAACPPFQKVAVPNGSRIQLAQTGPEIQVTTEARQARASEAAAVGAVTAASSKEAVGKQTLLGEVARLRQEQEDRLESEMSGAKRKNALLFAAGFVTVLLLGAAAFGFNHIRSEKNRLADEARRGEELERVSNPWTRVEQEVSPAVVHIRCSYRIRIPNGNEVSFLPVTGSGVQIRPGLILTARHVVEPWRFLFRDPDNPANWDLLEEEYRFKAEYDRLEVQFPGQQPLKATLVSGTGSRPEDLALIQIQQTVAPSVAVGPTNDEVRVTDEIAIMGYPGDLGQYAIAVSSSAGDGTRFAQMTEVVPTFIKGTVAQPLTGTGESSHRLFFDASIEPGNSGGPVVNRDGNLVGIVSLQFQRPGDPIDVFGHKLPTWKPMEAGSVAVSPDDIHSFLRKHGIAAAG